MRVWECVPGTEHLDPAEVTAYIEVEDVKLRLV